MIIEITPEPQEIIVTLVDDSTIVYSSEKDEG